MLHKHTFQWESAGLFGGAFQPFQASLPPAASQCSLPTLASEAAEYLEGSASTIHSGLSQDLGRKIYTGPKTHIFCIILVEKKKRYCTKDVNFRHPPMTVKKSEDMLSKQLCLHAVKKVSYCEGSCHEPIVFVIWLASSRVRGAQPFWRALWSLQEASLPSSYQVLKILLLTAIAGQRYLVFLLWGQSGISFQNLLLPCSLK